MVVKQHKVKYHTGHILSIHPFIIDALELLTVSRMCSQTISEGFSGRISYCL